MEHELKTDPLPWEDIAAGRKTFEVRRDDRGYEVGDVLFLAKTRYTAAEMAEGKPLEYTGAWQRVGVQHLLRGPAYGIPDGFVVMSIRPTWKQDKE